MFDSEKDVSALQQGRFVRECLQMEIRQNRSDGPNYSGPGRIYQDDNGQLRVSLYAPGAQPYFDRFLPAGTIFPADYYWTLRATDYDGGRWECRRILVNPGWSQPGGGTLISAPLPYVESTEEELVSSKGYGFQGFILHQFNLPANRRTSTRTERDLEWSEAVTLDTAVFDAGSVSFLLHQDEPYLRLSAVDRTTPLHTHFAERVREALQFTFAYPLVWGATIETKGSERKVYIRGGPSPRLQPRIQPPVPYAVFGAETDTWDLFCAYFDHVCKNEQDEVHRLSTEWNEVLRSSIASLETEALVCSIAVESTCRYIHSQRGAASAGAESDPSVWGAKVDSFLEHEGCDQRTRRRVAGVFGKMGRGDHTDLLIDLKNTAVVNSELVDVWSNWRHIMAHGDREAQAEIQRLHRVCDSLTTLLYQLYFHAIGYRGIYSYFALPGWPLRTYPDVHPEISISL